MGSFSITNSKTHKRKDNKMIENREKRTAEINTTVLGFIYSSIFGFMFMFTKLLLNNVNDEYHLIAFRNFFAFLTLTTLIKLNLLEVNYKDKPTGKLIFINILGLIDLAVSNSSS